MKMEMTARDKKLLIGLSIFVIVVCIGYWGIYPMIKDIFEYKDEIIEQEELKEINDLKLLQVPMFEIDNENMEKQILESRAQFFGMMSSDEIDRYFTELVLNYGLYAYDLNIDMPEAESELEPYKYSEKAILLSQEELEEESGVYAEDDDETADLTALDNPAGSNPDELYDMYTGTGIYAATVTLRLGGEYDRLLKLINDLSTSKQKLRVISYEWSNEQSVKLSDETDGENTDSIYELVDNNVLMISIEIYMCEE